MPRRPLHWCCLLWATLWLGVIAPGHERGVVKLPGTGCAAAAADDADAAKHACCRKPAGNDAEKPSEDPATRCAICKLNASLNLPPVALLVSIQCDLLGELHPPLLTSPATAERAAVYLGRAPPRATCA